ncbi:hypothetical protein A3A84_01775 [Candidatus Collierbacteria bacterium RIFCSPLOWO2_01_FULL_50_23]|uniref:Uncharacterized protein n=2 Tax=Candidatus Collieribacteriota TaxID=1752725 RepID=A0A1F5EXK2_9BACT|nr:MAG: hypothetical protein A3D09_03960 [Candidatus Collierbacteria bacterium RIFCSPHIGHO2_02_FULL_49_10]OGD72318.1 MAG: hypothetical protein A2703_02080 [Candidatus Collierbacteria bacterium RIFCSPHIGHO2_01_FULL_50_25]OGD75256.1 MAG: hypothetical protein A3A84_01775 [Candidatus Collierbacteria bacterium RIFCSPLOWO2_01_FULL_50_23]
MGERWGLKRVSGYFLLDFPINEDGALFEPHGWNEDGMNVLGWEVANPYRAASERLDEAIGVLLKIEGAEKQLGRVYVMYGDMCAAAAIGGSMTVAENYYNKAIEVFEEIGDYDDLEVAVAKSVALGE